MITWIEPFTVASVEFLQRRSRILTSLLTKLHSTVADFADTFSHHLVQVFTNALTRRAKDTVFGLLVTAVADQVLSIQFLFQPPDCSRSSDFLSDEPCGDFSVRTPRYADSSISSSKDNSH